MKGKDLEETEVDQEIREKYFPPRKYKKYARASAPSASRTPMIEGGTYKMINGQLQLVQGPRGGKLKVSKSKDQPVLNLEVGGIYKSMDGRKIEINKINKGSIDNPVLGNIQLLDGTWVNMVWDERGFAKKPFGQGNDICAEWSEA